MPKSVVNTHYYIFVILLGMLGGGILTSDLNHLFGHSLHKRQSVKEEASPRENSEKPLFSKKTAFCQAVCVQPPEKEKITFPQRPLVSRKSSGVTRVSHIPKNPKNPNAIRISLAEAPTILSEVKKVNGKGVCIKKNDKGRKSKKYSKPHIDRQCCLDPDEIPNPRCLYR